MHQGIGWFKRKIIANATITLAIKHYKDDAGVEKIDIDQVIHSIQQMSASRLSLQDSDRGHSRDQRRKDLDVDGTQHQGRFVRLRSWQVEVNVLRSMLHQRQLGKGRSIIRVESEK